MSLARVFHSVTVLGKKKYLKQSVMGEYWMNLKLWFRLVTDVEGVKYWVLGEIAWLRLLTVLYILASLLFSLLICKGHSILQSFSDILESLPTPIPTQISTQIPTQVSTPTLTSTQVPTPAQVPTPTPTLTWTQVHTYILAHVFVFVA